MVSNKTRELINLAINNLELNNITQEDINKANNYLKEAIKQIKNENATTVEDLEKEFELQKNAITQPLPIGADLEIPYIAREFYNHTFKPNQKVEVGFYIDTDTMDFYEKDIVSLFRIKAYVDHKLVSTKVFKSGSHIFDFGVLAEGEHILALEGEDIYGRKSFRDYFEIRVKDVTIVNRYEITLDDLKNYGVKNDYTEDVCEPMTTMLEELSKNYNYLVLPQGTYKTAIDKTIDIPTNTTVDLNGATIKMEEGKAGNHALQLRILQCEDTHVINGTIQGDYDTHDFANSTNNSEWVHGIDISGRSKYSSFENIEVKDVTGYGITSGFAADKDGAGYCWGVVNFKTTSKVSKNATTGHLDASNYTDFIDISKFKVDGCNYFQLGKYLGYQGCPSTAWYYTLEMYNENKELVDTLNGYYYRRVYIPQNVRYIKLKNYANSTLALWMDNTCLFAFKVPVNCEVKNCKIDRARCVGFAPSAMESLRLLDTEFTRSGYNGAKCAFDSEDGWDMMHDFYMTRCNFHDNPNNDWLTCAGHNFLLENNEYNGSIYIWTRTEGMVVRNNKVKGINEGKKQESKHYKIYNNEATNSISSTRCTIKNCKATSINGASKNCEIYSLSNSQNHNGTNNKYILKDSWSGRLTNPKIKDSEINHDGTKESCTLSFNKIDTDALFDNVRFNGRYDFSNHDQFNSGTFKNCEIDHIYIDARCQDKPNNSEVVFENCKMTFSSLLMKGVPYAYSEGECHFRFKNCEIVDDGEEYSWTYGKVTDMIYFFSKPVDNSYIIFENCTITKQGGALVGSRTKEEIVKCNIEFNNCTLNGDFKIFGETTIPEKTNIKVFIDGVEQL